MNQLTAITQGAHHVGLTVPNLDEALAFFLNTLNFTRVGEKPEYPAVFVTDGVTMITLWQVYDPATAVSFDRRNVVGLHHLALAVPSSAALQQLHTKLSTDSTVTVEFAPELLGQGPTEHMMVHIPGGIRVEFIASAPR